MIEPSNTKPELPHAPRSVPLPGNDKFCSSYVSKGWRQILYFHLGEGAQAHLEQIYQAARLWNQALLGSDGVHLIDTVEDASPRNMQLERGFWDDWDARSEDLVQDGQNVIYFNPSPLEDSPGGFARYRWDRYGVMVEADIYINTADEEQYGPHVAITHQAMNASETHGMYLAANWTTMKLIHEMGHAIGLLHVPLSGNIMSYNAMPQVQQSWGPTLAILEWTYRGQLSLSEMPFMHRHDSIFPYMVAETDKLRGEMEFFGNWIQLGEQDRSALMCVYEFEDWNH